MKVSQVKIYIDEDAMDSDLVAALRSRGVTVITAQDAGLTEKPDGEQLAFATTHECVLYTFNVSDFYRLHSQWIGAGREHAGMILAPQQRFSVGEQLRRILRLRAAMTAASMRNKAEFLGSWGRPCSARLNKREP
jgi:hypothetical protein